MNLVKWDPLRDIEDALLPKAHVESVTGVGDPVGEE